MSLTGKVRSGERVSLQCKLRRHWSVAAFREWPGLAQLILSLEQESCTYKYRELRALRTVHQLTWRG